MKTKDASQVTVQDVQLAIGMTAKEWAGNCHAVASAIVDSGLVNGDVVYGHWTGPIATGSMFASPTRPFARHAWILLQDGRIFDATRWVFEDVDPYIHVGWPNEEDDSPYDEGGDKLRELMMTPPPAFDDDSPEKVNFLKMLDLKERTHVRLLLEHGRDPLSFGQMFWLANLPYSVLQPHAAKVYSVLSRIGHESWVPIDNLRRAERETRKK